MSSKSPAKNALKIVFDTNIYISAFLKSGFSRELFNLALEGKIELFSSSEIFLELKNKLKEKFHVKEADIELFISTVSQIAKVVLPSRKLKIIKADPKDNIVLECALAAKANLIVSLDKHLIKLKGFQKIGIVHPGALVWILPNEFEK